MSAAGGSRRGGAHAEEHPDERWLLTYSDMITLLMALFTTAGGFAPTLGIIGTVLSLVHVLENLSDPGGLGKSIASAFIATLYGVGSANIIYLPVGNKLKALAAEELNYREMQLEAILAIQAGDNPRTIGEKLETYIPPAARVTDEQQQELKQAA